MRRNSSFATVNLSDGRFTLIPPRAFILNPEREGSARYVYLFCTYVDPEKMKFEDAGSIYAWFSDFNNLHIFGMDHQIVIAEKNLYEEALAEVKFVHMSILGEYLEVGGIDDDQPELLIITWYCQDLLTSYPVGYTAFGLGDVDKLDVGAELKTYVPTIPRTEHNVNIPNLENMKPWEGWWKNVTRFFT